MTTQLNTLCQIHRLHLAWNTVKARWHRRCHRHLMYMMTIGIAMCL